MGDQFPVTLHCIDLQKCMVMTIMEDSVGRDVEHFDPNGDEEAAITYGHGEYDHFEATSPSLFGFPSDRPLIIDWYDTSFGQDKPKDFEEWFLAGGMNLRPTEKNGGTFRATQAEGLSFVF
mmetsp:Transcript_12466/g.35692  ORF Transcript_12466/g.35692 Transcript_12466/m.35692 type:complete len:121 (-) Transcript_12466:132-494(-)